MRYVLSCPDGLEGVPHPRHDYKHQGEKVTCLGVQAVTCQAARRGVPHPRHEHMVEREHGGQEVVTCPGYDAATFTVPGASAQGLRLRVLRSALGDCSLRGVSSVVDHVTLVGILDQRVPKPGVQPIPRSQAGPFAPSADAPPAVLVYRQIGNVVCSVQPLVEDFGAAHFMAGGTYVMGDSRFSDLTFYGAVSFHDRREF
jgi:hypothetical protein